MTVPTPSTPDPDRSRRDQRYDPWSRPGSPHVSAAGGAGGAAHAEHSGYAERPGYHAFDGGAAGGHGGFGGDDSYGPDEDPGGWPMESGAGGRSVGAETRTAALCALLVTVLGVGLGLLWLWLAPRIPLFTDGKAVFLKDPEGEEAVGADGTFVLLALAFGIVTGAGVFLRSRRGDIALVIGLTVGALLGSVVAWRLGVWLGPNPDVAELAKSMGKGKNFDGPLKLQAKGALLAWAVAGLATHLVLTGLFGKRDPDPAFSGLLEDTGPPRDR